ncbi:MULTISPECIES: hypothetical protein [unclassified Microbacterium]|uniref:hypothetical protein n=1 Tax=unclassified Microbacterium TaxID=2609290 RepID=UPI00257E8314|nr:MULTISPECIES: hypothetical protein [unclassified Microbacterium]
MPSSTHVARHVPSGPGGCGDRGDDDRHRQTCDDDVRAGGHRVDHAELADQPRDVYGDDQGSDPVAGERHRESVFTETEHRVRVNDEVHENDRGAGGDDDVREQQEPQRRCPAEHLHADSRRPFAEAFATSIQSVIRESERQRCPLERGKAGSDDGG